MRSQGMMLLLALALTPVLAQTTTLATNPQTVSQAEVRLEAKDGQTQFALGEVIRLELVFRDPAFPHAEPDARGIRVSQAAPGQKTVNAMEYPDLADAVAISPADGWFQWRGRSHHDYVTQTPVDEAGVHIPLVLNQGYVFRKPGHYEITVTTQRMGRDPVTTNAVGIDIAPRSAAEESALVQSLDARIAGSTNSDREEAAEALAALPGDDAARAKVKWLLASTQEEATLEADRPQADDMVAMRQYAHASLAWQRVEGAMSEGLAATSDQTLQLQLLRQAWADPKRDPDGTLQSALQNAEALSLGQMQPGWVMAVSAQPKDDAASRELEAEHRKDVESIITSLPQRTGEVRRDTAYDLVEDNKLNPEQLAIVKPVVLEEFPSMEPMAQSMLIEAHWKDVADPSLAPSLRAMIESSAQNIDKATALERLIEIDEPEAKPYIIRMVCDAQRGLQLKNLNGVKADRIPEVDACLSALLTKGERRPNDFDWQQAAARAARFATPAILPAVKAAWTDPSQDSSMLALLIRDDPRAAVQLLNREPDIQWYPTNTVYEALGRPFPPEVLAWLRSHLTMRPAAYELSQAGEPGDRALLERQLATLRQQWQGKSEIENPAKDSPAYAARQEETELVSSLFAARAWTLTNEDRIALTRDCLGDGCRQYAPRQSAAAAE